MVIVKSLGNNFISNNILECFLFDFEIPCFEVGKPVPKLRDIWILGSTETKQHYVKFYMPWTKYMFRARNKMIKIEHIRTISRMISWSLDVKTRWVRNQLECIDFVVGIDQKGVFLYFHLQ
jgi:hypothetical protein